MTTAIYDYIVVGAGAAGCVLASRLTEDQSIRVLLLEAGSERSNPLLTIPIGEVLLMGNPRYDWRFETEGDPTINGRSVQIPRGRLLGGSNAINGMLFVRGQREDYEDWKSLGNPGWNWNDVLPYFNKLENASSLGFADRGHTGPLSINAPQDQDTLCDAFLESAGNLGYRVGGDYNSGSQDGFGYYQVTQDAGRRSSAKDTFLRAARRRPNLTLITEAHVSNVILDQQRCVGVRFLQRGIEHVVRASHEVILSAGVVQSPQILELSGIGSPTVLAMAGVQLRHALPGVGENFRDHFGLRLKWRVRDPITFNERSRGLRLVREVARYAVGRRGLLSSPIALGYGFVRSHESSERADLQYHFAPASYHQGPKRMLDTKPGVTLGMYPLRPQSKGSVHIKSADPFIAPAICPRFLDHDVDKKAIIAGVRIGRTLMNSLPFAQHIENEIAPMTAVQSDEEIITYARCHGDTSYHPVGTCQMSSGPMGVVDERLRVRALQNLRVIDSSIMPTMVSGNTNAATMMIAEKGAAMVLQDRNLINSQVH